MSEEDAGLLPDAIRIALEVTAILDRLGIPYLIGGSVASIVHGEARLTNDLDLVAKIETGQVASLVAALESDFYIDERAIQRAIRERSSFNLIYLATMFKIDVFIQREDEWALEQMRQRVDRFLLPADQSTIRKVANAETLILQKLVWYRNGGEVSDRQWKDVLGVLKVQGAGLDREYLLKWAPVLGVSDLLERALLETRSAA